MAAGLGNHALALDELERAMKERSGWLVFLRVDPRFDGLRSETRFQQVLEGMTNLSGTRDSSGSAQRKAG